MFKKITLEDKAVFEKMFTVCQPGISEYTFTNLFIWSPKKIEYTAYEEGLIMTAVSHGERYFLPPIGFNDCQKTIQFLVDYGSREGIRQIFRLPEYQKKYVKKIPCRISPDRDNYDYIYKAELLSSLKGWRLDGKRGFVKKFRENYSYVYQVYDESLREECLRLAHHWADARKEKDPSIEDELTAIHSLLDHYHQLNVVGGVLLVDGKAAAFSFGERLNDTTFVIHFEKADPAFIGSYQMINQLFVQNEVHNKYLFVNREQDLGIEGIRKAKLSYAPLRLLKKYTVKF